MKNLLTAGPSGGPIPRLDSSASPVDFKYGKCKNDDPQGAGNGTPLQIEVGAEPLQAMYAVLNRAEVVPSENFENCNVSDFVNALENLFFKVGDLKHRFAAASPNDNWLVCDGSTFSEITYPDLFALLGGNTTPDFKGRVLACYDSGNADFDVIGETGGQSRVTLLTTEMPSHEHVVTYSDNQDNSGILADRAQSSSDVQVNTSSVGGGNSHENLMPYSTVQILIKAK